MYYYRSCTLRFSIGLTSLLDEEKSSQTSRRDSRQNAALRTNS
jgi:hypothetical protein